jgi:tetratricopeptide (TPR) repeat protein
MAAYLDAASGLALTYGGNPAEARPILEQSVAAADDTGCPSARAFARYALAELLAAGNPTLAQQRLEEAIELAQSVSATFVAGVAELSLATLHARTGRPRAALAHYPALIDLWRLAGNWTQQWNTLRTLVFVLADLDEYRAAAELMAAIAASGTEPTWGDDAAAWAKVRDKVHAQLEPAIIDTAEATAYQLGRGDVLALAEAHVREAEAHMEPLDVPMS